MIDVIIIILCKQTPSEFVKVFPGLTLQEANMRYVEQLFTGGVVFVLLKQRHQSTEGF